MKKRKTAIREAEAQIWSNIRRKSVEKIKKFVCQKWFLLFVGSLLFLQTAVFLIFRENSYIQVHDNLDLFATQLQIMKNTGTFFARDAILPILGGISRDTFGSEFSLYNIFFDLSTFYSKLCKKDTT